MELLLIQNQYEKAKDTFQNLKNKVEERKENKRMTYCDYIEFKRLEKIIINEFSKQNEFSVASVEYPPTLTQASRQENRLPSKPFSRKRV